MRDEHDPEQALERMGDELEERKDKLEEHLDEAREKLAERAEDARHLGEGEDVVGSRPARPDADDDAGGDDPSGAIDTRAGDG